jgi:hypothetical protein
LVLTEHLPADEQLFDQQWYEDSASQWSIVNGQKKSPFTTHHSPPHSYGDSAGFTPDFPFNQGDNFELNNIAIIKLSLCHFPIAIGIRSVTLFNNYLPKNQIGSKCNYH